MLLTSIAAGCTYLRQRARDAADIITVGVEDGGFGASLQAGPIRVPSLYYGDGGGAGLVGGQFTTYDYDQWDALLAARTYLGGIDDDTRAKESSLAYYAAIVPVPGSKGMLVDLHQPTDHEFGWSSPRRWGPRVGQVEISAGIGGGVRIGFNVVEALDFFGGWFGLDLLDDDPPWFPPDRPKRIPERLPAPGETPQPSHDEMRPQHPLAMRFPGAFGTRWFAVDLGGRKIGVAVRSLTHDASARRLVTQLDFAIFPAGEGPFLSMRSELSSFEDEAPYVLVSQDEFERLTGRDHFTHDDWSEAGGRRKQLIAGVYRERELHSTRPKLTLFGPVPIETPFESLDAGFRGATDLDDPRGATQFEVVERVPGSSGDPLSSRVTIREWKQGGVAEQSTYRSDGVLVAYVTGAMEWVASDAKDAFDFPVAADVDTIRFLELENAGDSDQNAAEVELEWPAGPDLMPTTDTQTSSWIEEGRLQRVVTRRAKAPTPEERAMRPDPARFARYLKRTDAFDFDDPRLREIVERRAAGLDPWEKVEVDAFHVSWHVRSSDTKHFSASDVQRFPRGDCTSHAMLLVALLRSDGIPARIVDGFIRDPVAPQLAAHRWVEAWVGRWIPIEPVPVSPIADAYHVRTSVEDDAAYVSNIPWGRKVRVVREGVR